MNCTRIVFLRRWYNEGGSLVQNFAIYVDLQMEDGTGPWTQFTEMACKSTIEGLARHARHMINVGGVSVVGIGTDFDGIGREDLAVHDASGMQKLADGFAEQGFAADEIERICYRNVLEMYKEVL